VNFNKLLSESSEQEFSLVLYGEELEDLQSYRKRTAEEHLEGE